MIMPFRYASSRLRTTLFWRLINANLVSSAIDQKRWPILWEALRGLFSTDLIEEAKGRTIALTEKELDLTPPAGGEAYVRSLESRVVMRKTPRFSSKRSQLTT